MAKVKVELFEACHVDGRECAKGDVVAIDEDLAPHFGKPVKEAKPAAENKNEVTK